VGKERVFVIFAAGQRLADGMSRITVIVQHQVWVATGAIKPATDLRLFLEQHCPDNHLCRSAISVSRCRGNVPLVSQALPKLVVGSANVLLQGAATGSFIFRKIVDRASCGRASRRGRGGGRVLASVISLG